MQHTRPRAVRTAALVAGAGLLTTTMACLTAGTAAAATAPADLGFYAAATTAAPGGGVVVVGSTYDETTNETAPHAAIVKDGTVTPITGLPEVGSLSAVTVSDGQIVLGGSDADGAASWVLSAEDASHTAVADGAPADWTDIRAFASDASVFGAAGTTTDGSAVAFVDGATSRLPGDASPTAMAVESTGDTARGYVAGVTYGAEGTTAGALWVTAPGSTDATAYGGDLGDVTTALTASDGIVYVADQRTDPAGDPGYEVQAIDTTADPVRTTTVDVTSAGPVNGLALSPDGNTLYAAAGSALYAVPVPDFATWDPENGDFLAADGSLNSLALSGTTGHLTAYSTTFSESEGSAVLQLDSPAEPSFTAKVSAEDRSAIQVTVPGDWFEGRTTVHVGEETVVAGPDDCELATTDFTCTIGGLDRGTTYDVSVERSNVLGSTTSSTQQVRTPAVLDGPSRVTFAGTAQVGRTLTAEVGTGWPAGTTFTYAWGWNGGQFGGLAGTGRTLTVPASLAGRQLQLIVTGTKGEDDREVRSAFVTVKAGTLTLATPRITGKAKVGRRVTAVAGSSSAGARLSYQWYAGAKPIKGAHATTLKLTKKLKGTKVSVRVTATRAGYASVTKASGAVKVKG